MPMYVKILGPATKQAEKLLQNTAIAMKKLHVKASYEKVSEFSKVAAYGIASIPALVIDGKLISAGTVLEVEEVMKLVKSIM